MTDYTFFIHDDEYAWHHTGSILDKYNEAVMSNQPFYNINDKCYYINIFSIQGDEYSEYMKWYKTHIEEYIPLSKVPKDLMYSYRGSAQFLVHKDRIRSLPIKFYKRLYNWIITTDISNYYSSRYLEWTWHVFWEIYPR